MNEDEEQEKMVAALLRNGATEEDINAYLDEQSSVMAKVGSTALPAMARSETNAPYRNTIEARTAHQQVARDNLKDLGGVAAAAVSGAVPFGLADKIPIVKRGTDYLHQRAPDVAGLAKVGGALASGGMATKLLLGKIAPVGSNLVGRAAANTAVGGLMGGAYGDGAGDVGLGAAFGAGSVLLPALARAASAAPKKTLSVAKGVGNLARGRLLRAGGHFLDALPAPKGPVESANTVEELIGALRRPGSSTAGEDILEALGPKRLGGSPTPPPSDGPPALKLMEPSTRTGPKPGLLNKYPKPEGPRISRSDDARIGFRQPVGNAVPKVEELDDPILQAMARQVATGKAPVPKPSQARGLEPKPVKGKGTREAIDTEAKKLDLDPDQIRGMSDDDYLVWKREQFGAPDDRAAYGQYLKKHGQGSGVRRGEHDDLTRNAEAMAKKAELQAEADALPDTPEGEEARERLYAEWQRLKQEYGRSTLKTVGTLAASGGALTAALAARARKDARR